MAGLLDFLSLRDMFDGGGAGASGSEFKGGALSDLLNSLGIKPMGSMQHMEQARPMARPAGVPPMPQPMAPAAPAPQPSPYAPNAIATTALPPMGQMRDEELVKMLLQALQQAPHGYGVGPR